MKKAPLWYSLLPLLFLMLAGVMRFWPEPGAPSMWEQKLGPWLGEAPAGVQVIEKNAAPDEPFFIVPANPPLKAEALRIFGLSDTDWSYCSYLKGRLERAGVDNTETLRPYLRDSAIEADISPACLRYNEYSYLFQPLMFEKEDGTLLISLAYPPDKENAIHLTPPHPEYLDEWTNLKSYLYVISPLFLVALPAFICCASWLWVRGRTPHHESYVYVCLFIPIISGIIFVLAHLELSLSENGPEWGGFLFFITVVACSVSVINVFCTCIMTLLAPMARKPFKRWHA